MKHLRWAIVLFAAVFSWNASAAELFPDGTPIPEWFGQNAPTDIRTLGTHYRITDHGVTAADSTLLQTEQIQALIDRASQAGGGVIVIPRGVFLSGSLFFKPGTHLHLEEGAVLKGSDDISHFALLRTRMEGQTVNYFAALINADGLDGFTISGSGTINGNGLRYWRAFWLRRRFNPQCTNMDEMRPRLVYISNSKNVQLSGVRLVNSPFWTTHLYKCENVKLLDLHIFSPAEPVRAPSSDAVDIDVCTNVLIKGCYLSVNDDAVALKGGKGPRADQDPDNGGNYNIIIEDCVYGYCHGVLTCGSESIHDRNILVRRCRVEHAERLLWLKMRGDTPQNYEYITVEDITGSGLNNFIYIQPWTQFFDLKGEPAPFSYGSRIVMRNIDLECANFFNVSASPDQYDLSDFTFENLDLRVTRNADFHPEYVDGFTLENITVNGNKLY
jgi:polygalacturonase